MTHAEMDELYELFVLRTLEPELGSAIEQHLRDGCAHCETKVREATALVGSLADIVEITAPPAHLRDRVLSSVRPRTSVAPRRGNRMAGIYALAGLCAALLAVCVWLGTETSELNSRLEDTARERRWSCWFVVGEVHSTTRSAECGRMHRSLRTMA